MKSDSVSPSIPRDLLSLCIASGDVAALIPFLRGGPPCPHDFPESHRLIDFVAGPALGYRVCRCSVCDEFISIWQTDTPSSEPGVPLEMTGTGLQRWVADEHSLLEDDESSDHFYHRHDDWSRYL